MSSQMMPFEKQFAEKWSFEGVGDTLTKVINFKFALQPHQKYNTTQYEELGFS